MRDESTGKRRKLYSLMRNIGMCDLQQRLLVRLHHGDDLCGGEMLTEFRGETTNERDHLEYVGLDGRIILKWIVKYSIRGSGLY